MLAVGTYTKEYVDACRSKVALHVSAYKSCRGGNKRSQWRHLISQRCARGV